MTQKIQIKGINYYNIFVQRDDQTNRGECFESKNEQNTKDLDKIFKDPFLTPHLAFRTKTNRSIYFNM